MKERFEKEIYMFVVNKLNSISWKSLGDGVSRQEKDLFYRLSWNRVYPLWLQVQQTRLQKYPEDYNV